MKEISPILKEIEEARILAIGFVDASEAFFSVPNRYRGTVDTKEVLALAKSLQERLDKIADYIEWEEKYAFWKSTPAQYRPEAYKENKWIWKKKSG